MILYARAGERVYGTRTVMQGHPQRPVVEDYHHATVRHDIFIGELPDFPACLGDWQQVNPPVSRHFIRELENIYTTNTGTHTDTAGKVEVLFSTATETKTNIKFADLPEHGGGQPAEFGVPWSGESWWRPFEHEVGGDRASLHYDLRFRGRDGKCVWGMDRLSGSGA